MKTAGVYRIRCKINGRNYVGSSSKDWRNRRNGHACLLRAGRHPSKKMQDDWNAFGSEAFEFLLVCECPEGLSMGLEKEAADAYKAFCPEMGYNTKPMAESRFRAGRKASGGVIRFSRMVRPETARKLAELVKLEEGGLVKLEQASVMGWKGRFDGVDKLVGFRHSNSPEEFYELVKSMPGPISMEAGSSDVIRLSARIKELEQKIRELENTYSQ